MSKHTRSRVSLVGNELEKGKAFGKREVCEMDGKRVLNPGESTLSLSWGRAHVPFRLGSGAPAWELAGDTHPLHASQAPARPGGVPGSSRQAGRAVSCLLLPSPRKHEAGTLCLERFSADPAEGTHSHLQRLVEGVFPLGRDLVLGVGGARPWRESVRLGCPCCRRLQRSAQHALESGVFCLSSTK